MVDKTERNKTKHNTIQRNWQHRVLKTERNKTKTQHNLERLVNRVHKTEKNKTNTKHNPEKLATQGRQDGEKQNKNTAQSGETGIIG